MLRIESLVSLVCAFRPEPREVAQAEREDEDRLRNIHILNPTDSGRYVPAETKLENAHSTEVASGGPTNMLDPDFQVGEDHLPTKISSESTISSKGVPIADC